MADTAIKTIEELLDGQLPAAPQETCDATDSGKAWTRWDNWFDHGQPWRN